MLYAASSFNQNLCHWGTTISSTASVGGAFTASGGTVTTNPDLTLARKGPFCHDCPQYPTKAPTDAPSLSPSDAPTPVPTVSPTSDFFETATELKTAIASGVYTSGDSPVSPGVCCFGQDALPEFLTCNSQFVVWSH